MNSTVIFKFTNGTYTLTFDEVGDDLARLVNNGALKSVVIRTGIKPAPTIDVEKEYEL